MSGLLSVVGDPKQSSDQGLFKSSRKSCCGRSDMGELMLIRYMRTAEVP